MPNQESDGHPEQQRHTVLDVFGLTLEVSNPRLAELLTMDAKEALTTDIRDVFGGKAHTVAASEQEDPEIAALMPDARTVREEEERKSLRGRARQAGAALGFTVQSDGTWTSPTGIVIYVREFVRTVTLAAAAHFVRELQGLVTGGPFADRSSALLVCAQRDAADVLKVAIRQARAYDVMRVACIDHLEELAGLVERGDASHTHALAVVAPIAAIDVGEVLAVLRAGRCDDADSTT